MNKVPSYMEGGIVHGRDLIPEHKLNDEIKSGINDVVIAIRELNNILKWCDGRVEAINIGDHTIEISLAKLPPTP